MIDRYFYCAACDSEWDTREEAANCCGVEVREGWECRECGAEFEYEPDYCPESHEDE